MSLKNREQGVYFDVLSLSTEAQVVAVIMCDQKYSEKFNQS